MGNPYIDKMVNNQIEKMISKGQLYTPEMVDEAIDENLDIWTKMITIALNSSLGIGKQRFRERVQPVLNTLEDEYFDNKKTADQEYAISVIDRLYAEIMD